MSIRITLPLPPGLQPQTAAEQNQHIDDMLAWGRGHADLAQQVAQERISAECLSCQFWALTNTVVRRDAGESAPEADHPFEQMVVDKFRRQWVAIYFVETASTRHRTTAPDMGEAVRRAGRLD